ncbi:MAG: sigma-54-dependent Fis family transcriptional regulator [Labilithrix sp.]|nr:sigma-54-dependent Fis family transcriptional regulator [Labilithrix sp.]MCW5814841.1 sigma-54-dependent Fis family transcriptional regulator [Labilithrix sp.]
MEERVSPKRPRVLVADDNTDVLDALRLLLKSEGFVVVPATSPAGAVAALQAEPFDAALLDMNYTRDTTSGGEGLDLITSLRAIDPALPILVLTAWGSVAGAVEAMKRGARDYVEKPWQNERLVAALRTQIELRAAVQESARLQGQSERELERSLPGMIATSKAMEPVKRLIERVASSDANVLVTGEHGTGKDVVARLIHARSPRARRAFVPVNAGALADGVFESELFGHVKGAFTDAKADRIGCFELADGGTLFLDEIGTMPTGQQAKLLRLLQTGEFSPVGSSRVRKADVRVVSATNADIAKEVARGAFREDLLYRLNTVEIRLPPLRDRDEDVIALAQHFLRVKAARYGKAIEGFAPDAAAALSAHRWPGNVRELEHVVERAVVLADAGAIGLGELDLRPAGGGGASGGAIERMTLADAEAYLIRKALDRASGNVVAAAQELGLSRSALYRRLQALGIKVQE